MSKKKTTYTWIIIVLICISLLFGAIGIIFQIATFNQTLSNTDNSAGNVVKFALTIISYIISIVLLTKLLKVTADVIDWVNIGFGISTLNVLLGILLIKYSTGFLAVFGIAPRIIYLLIIITIWITFYFHLKKAQNERLMHFS